MIRLTVKQMLYFDALAQTLHFGRAAEAAGVTQPALSAQIAEMEERLGCRLFERGGRIVAMTGDALRLQPKIERILADIRAVETTARSGRTAMEGRFRLGVIPTVAPYLLPVVLPELRRLYPELRLELREALTATLIQETAQGRLDGIVAAMPIDHPAIVEQELFEDRFLLAVPAADPDFISPPVPPESPALERLMLLEEGHCMRDQALAVCGRIKPATMANYGATSLTTLLQMVAHGFGVTLIPEMALSAAAGMRDLKVAPFSGPVPSRRICLAWRRNGPRSEICATLAGLIRELKDAVMSPEGAGSGGENMNRQHDPEHGDRDEADHEGRLANADAV